MENLYQTLNIQPSASAKDIKKAYKEQALKCHPDQTGSDDTIEQFRAVQEAYEILGDEERRASYDYEFFPHGKQEPSDFKVNFAAAHAYQPPDFDKEKAAFLEPYKAFVEIIESFAKVKIPEKDRKYDQTQRLERLKAGVVSSLENEIEMMDLQSEYIEALHNFKKKTKDLHGFNPYFWLKEVPSNLNYYEGRIAHYKGLS